MSNRTAFREALQAWYRQQARPLPWRTDPSLYRTVISEFMCQQTQVDTVLPYFARWMEQFPDFRALADASEMSVLKAWEGLGYYNRARNLHRLAQQIVTMPSLPRTPDEWRALPGIGPYTAAAISSINDRYPAAVVDGNVIRVLARLTADGRPFKGNAEAVKAFQPLADALLDPEAPGDHNQAMMELGATVCLKSRPLCLFCPVRGHCAAVRSGAPEQVPVLVRRQTEKVVMPRLYLVVEGAVLLERASAASRRLASVSELPRAEQLPECARGPLLITRRRAISNQQITEPIYAGIWTPECADMVARKGSGYAWQSLGELDAVTLSGPHRRWLRELSSEASDSPAQSPASAPLLRASSAG